MRRRLWAAIGIIVLAGATPPAYAAPGPNAVVQASEFDAVKAALWANEQKIYAARSHGDLSFYTDHISDLYLGWPPTSPRPFGPSALRADQRMMVGSNKEQLKSELVGFTLSGDTAVIYYINHRTMKPDGTPVDETFENIHVWVREAKVWRVIGAMSRRVPSPKS